MNIPGLCFTEPKVLTGPQTKHLYSGDVELDIWNSKRTVYIVHSSLPALCVCSPPQATRDKRHSHNIGTEVSARRKHQTLSARHTIEEEVKYYT